MLGTSDKRDYVKISKQVWEWARKKPEYQYLIEDLEDLELIAEARKIEGKTVSLEEYHSNRRIRT